MNAPPLTTDPAPSWPLAPTADAADVTLPPPPLAGRHLVLGVTGGVAAYKAAQLVRDLQRAGASVQVVMTEAATHFVGTATFQALSGRPVFTGAFDTRIDDGMAHIELSRNADAIIIAPASADFLAKVTHGLCDDLLSTLCLARDVPLLVAPAMNRQMWQNAATQRNINQLRADGVQVLGPDAGEQACGEVGAGRMLEPAVLVEELSDFFTPKALQGKRILMTAGPTYEAIDPVRGITNLSSGKMGYALAQACRQAGALVTLVSGPTALPRPYGVRFLPVQSAQQMLDTVMAELDMAASTISIDCFIGVAAVADWRPLQVASQKIKKERVLAQDGTILTGADGTSHAGTGTAGAGDTSYAGMGSARTGGTSHTGTAPAGADRPSRTGTVPADTLTLALTQTPDILASVARRPDAPYCVGFAAESEDLVHHATEKRARKGIPLLVGNLGPATFGQDDNTLILVDEHGTRTLPAGSKTALARWLAQELGRRLPA